MASAPRPAFTSTSFTEFRLQALADGFDEVLEREWAAGLELPEHTHPVALRVRVARGEVWLTNGGRTRHLSAGDSFTLERDAPHGERYGPEGATFWVARRH